MTFDRIDFLQHVRPGDSVNIEYERNALTHEIVKSKGIVNALTPSRVSLAGEQFGPFNHVPQTSIWYEQIRTYQVLERSFAPPGTAADDGLSKLV